MNDNQTRRLDMLNRIRVFATEHNSLFPASSKAAQLLASIQSAIVATKDGGTNQLSHDGDARAGTRSKADLFEELYEDLLAISRTARSLGDDIPGLEQKFRLPRSLSHPNVLASAKAFVQDATPLAAEFIAYELPADFLIDLAADIAAFESAEDDQDEGVTGRAGATESIGQSVAAGAKAARKLDTIMRNKLRTQPALLAEWLTASHTERLPRKTKTPAPAA